MKKLSFLLLLISTNIFSNAQALRWAKNFSSRSVSVGHDLRTDQWGNIYSTGRFDGKTDFDPGTATYYLNQIDSNYSHLYISKLDSSGNFIWAKSSEGKGIAEGYSITNDTSGNVYVTGYFKDTVDFDPAASKDIHISSDYDIFILKLNKYGNLIWVKSLGSSKSDIGYSIICDKYSNVFITGLYNGTVDFDPSSGTSNITAAGGSDIFILKLNTSGDFIWAKSMGGSNYNGDVGIDIKIDLSGNIYTMGTFRGTADFNPSSATYNLYSGNDMDIFISKLDSNGKFVWAKDIGGSKDDRGNSFIIYSDTNIYITGWFQDVVDFDPGTKSFNLTSAGVNDIFILKLDSSGNFIWVNGFGGPYYDNGVSIIVDKAGNIITSGSFQRTTVDFDPGSGIKKLYVKGSGTFILKSDKDGNTTWVRGLSEIAGDALNFDKLGNILLTGIFIDTVDFDPNKGFYILKTPNNYYNSFVCKFEECSIPTNAGKINGKTCISPATFTYSIDTVKGATGYEWIVPSGSKIVSGQNTISVKVQFGYNSGDVIVIPNNSCGDGTSSSLFVKNLDVGYTITPSMKVCEGDSVKLSGTGASIYNWSGGITDNVAFKSVSTATFKVTGKDTITGCTNSDSVTLTVIPFPSIIMEPTDQIINNGYNATFHLISSNKMSTFQWQQDTGKGFLNLTDSSKYLGAKNDTLTIKNINFFWNNFKYRCIASNGSCFDTSKIATLFIKCISIITTQPKNQTVNNKTNAKFSLSTSSISTTYQWQLNTGTGFVNLYNTGQYSGVNTEILNIKNAGISQNNYKFRCILKSGGCSDTSIIAILYVKCTLFITSQPTNQMVNVGSDILFVTASTSSSAAFRWQLNSGSGFITLANLGQYSGVTNDTLSISKVMFSQNTYIYRCIISEGGCYDTSEDAILIVNCVLKITSQPSNLTIFGGSNGQFTIVSSSTTASYQWQEDNGSGYKNLSNSSWFSGVTTDILNLYNVTLSQHNYHYRCIIEDAGCKDTSYGATLSVKCSFTFTSQPSNKNENVGSNTMFVVSSSSSSASFQWIEDKGGGFIMLTNNGQYSGVTNDTLIIKNVKFSQNNYKYSCIAKDGVCSITSNSALLTVNCTLAVSTHPSNQTANVGANVLFTTTSSSSTATYQWQQNPGTGFSNLSNGGQYSGVKNDTLIITNLTFSQNNYSYRCMVEDQGCTDSTKIALLTVKTIGVKKVLNSKIKIYPNPANSKIFIELTNGALTYNKLEIFNSNGQKCLSIPVDIGSQPIEVNVEKLNKGLYLVKLMNDNGYIYTKMIKN